MVVFSCLCFSSWDETARLMCVCVCVCVCVSAWLCARVCVRVLRGEFRTSIGNLLSLVLGIRRWF